MLNGKNVLLGVSGSIAAFKAAALASLLVKQGCEVNVILTEHARQFITPATFEAITHTRCITDLFERDYKFEVAHISLAQKADIAIVAPATANVIGKLAGGIADDMLSTTLLACRCPVVVAPAMNTAMFEHPAVQQNMQILQKRGVIVTETGEGLLACGDVGKGKLAEPERLLQYIEREIALPHDMAGKRVLVTAGPTQEAIDPVRYITNHSTGKMGYAMAKMAMLRGAQVTLISGKTALPPVPFVDMVQVTDAGEMFREVTARAHEADIILKAAAVADFTPAAVAEEKIKKSGTGMTIELTRTEDILQWLGNNRREGQFICGFSMETEHMVENSRKKLEKKKIDMIAANNLRVEGAGFGTETNVMTLITPEGTEELPKMSKEETAGRILDAVLKRLSK